jgi:hypothetical protein
MKKSVIEFKICFFHTVNAEGFPASNTTASDHIVGRVHYLTTVTVYQVEHAVFVLGLPGRPSGCAGWF